MACIRSLCDIGGLYQISLWYWWLVSDLFVILVACIRSLLDNHTLWLSEQVYIPISTPIYLNYLNRTSLHTNINSNISQLPQQNKSTYQYQLQYISITSTEQVYIPISTPIYLTEQVYIPISTPIYQNKSTYQYQLQYISIIRTSLHTNINSNISEQVYIPISTTMYLNYQNKSTYQYQLQCISITSTKFNKINMDEQTRQPAVIVCQQLQPPHIRKWNLRESHAVILRDRVVPASQVPSWPDSPGQLCTEEMTAWDSFSHP